MASMVPTALTELTAPTVLLALCGILALALLEPVLVSTGIITSMTPTVMYITSQGRGP